MSEQPASPARAILCGGLIAGALDITYACVRGILRGSTALRTLQSVASAHDLAVARRRLLRREKAIPLEQVVDRLKKAGRL